MIYLLLAIVSSSLVSIMMRLSEGRVKNNLSVQERGKTKETLDTQG